MPGRRGKSAPSQGRHTPNLPALLRTTVIALSVFVVLMAAMLMALAWLSDVRLAPGAVPGAQLYDLIRAVVAVGTLAGGTFAAVYAYRKQRIDEAASHRADAEQLSKRYQDAAAQLGHERAAVRLAGIYAIGRLADDWPENRQMCVDLLCAYLRMPYNPGRDSDDESVVRETVFEVMRARLTDPSRPDSWSDLSFDFSGGTYDTVPLTDCHFNKEVLFHDARFVGMDRWGEGKHRGWIGFKRSVFSNGMSLFQARVDGAIVNFDGARFLGGVLHLGGASFRRFNLFFRETEFVGGRIYLGGTEFTQRRTHSTLGHIWFDRATFDGTEFVCNEVKIEGQVELRMNDAKLLSGTLDLSGIELVRRIDDDDLPRVKIAPAYLADGVLTLPAEGSERVELTAGGEEP